MADAQWHLAGKNASCPLCADKSKFVINAIDKSPSGTWATAEAATEAEAKVEADDAGSEGQSYGVRCHGSQVAVNANNCRCANLCYSNTRQALLGEWRAWQLSCYCRYRCCCRCSRITKADFKLTQNRQKANRLGATTRRRSSSSRRYHRSASHNSSYIPHMQAQWGMWGSGTETVGNLCNVAKFQKKGEDFQKRAKPAIQMPAKPVRQPSLKDTLVGITKPHTKDLVPATTFTTMLNMCVSVCVFVAVLLIRAAILA